MPPTIYLPEDPDYTLVDSVRDSVRFAHYCLEPASHGRWLVPSSVVRSDGSPADGHPLCGLERQGGEANALGGALILYRWAGFDQNHILEKVALGLLDHMLDDGFLCAKGVPYLFRDTSTGEFFLNDERDNDWYPPSDMARIALQLLWWADALGEGDRRPDRLRAEAGRIGELLAGESWNDSWPAARRHMTGKSSGDAGAEGLYLAWLLMELEARGLAATSERARELIESFLRRGGIYAWGLSNANAPDSTIGRALAMRVLRRAADRFRDPSCAEFALDQILPTLESRLIREDLRGLPTTGLVASDAAGVNALMADAAECSLACQEAADSTGDRDHLCEGVTILRAVARLHHRTAEPHGFLAAGLDLESNTSQCPVGEYTTPLYSNLLHVEAALVYLTRRVA
jgi:hypothetical protein